MKTINCPGRKCCKEVTNESLETCPYCLTVLYTDYTVTDDEVTEIATIKDKTGTVIYECSSDMVNAFF